MSYDEYSNATNSDLENSYDWAGNLISQAEDIKDNIRKACANSIKDLNAQTNQSN